MATAKEAAPKRDYKAERERTKLNKQKAAGGIDAQPEPEKPKKAPPKVSKEQEMPSTTSSHLQEGETVHLLLSQIVSDPGQPRKFFEPNELENLAESIKIHGVIQEVLVRPIGNDLFMIVFGERRVRGSVMAGCTTIPAKIKEMSEDEARELQLVENLQRHNMHPMEEAVSFLAMSKAHSVEDIALRIGKSSKFVAMRIMLNDLIEQFQEIFFANRMSIGQAVMLCKIDADSQHAIFSEQVGAGWKDDQSFQLDDINWLVEKRQRNLDSAPFKTEDSELYPAMGPCGKCRFNSGNSLSLFMDDHMSRICGNPVCYNIKCAKAYTLTVEEALQDPAVVFVASHFYTEQDKAKVKEVEKMNVSIMPPGSWKRVDQMQKPILEQWIADNEDSFEPDEETREGFEARMKVEWEEGMKEWEENFVEIDEARAQGKVHKAFIVAGNGAGELVEIMPTNIQGEIVLAGGESSDPGVAAEIKKIQAKEERAIELDGEKIWTEVRSQMLGGGHFIKDTHLSFTEFGALAAALYDGLGWEERKEFAHDVLKVKYHDDALEMHKAFSEITSPQQCVLYRAFIRSKLFPLPGSHMTSYVNAAGFAVAKSLIPNTVKNIEAEQYAKAAKRAEKVKKKIADLTEPKEEEVIAAEEPAPEIEE